MNTRAGWSAVGVVVLVVFGWGAAGAAHAQATPPPRPDLGAPGPEHAHLDALVGSWDVTLEIPVAPGRTIQGSAGCEAAWVMDGRFVRQEYTSVFGGKPLTIVRYVGFDRHHGKLIELQLESTHTDVMHGQGSISADGRTLSGAGRHVDVASGKVVDVTTLTTVLDRDTFTLKLAYVDPDGGPEKAITLTHKRRK